MEHTISFDYFYGAQADQFSFYRIPKALFQNPYFRDLSSDAKILYGLMLDRMSLSIKNQWFDKENRAYIYFSVEDIMELLNCGKNKAIKSLQELDTETGIGLIEKKRQGFGKTSIIYVKSFLTDQQEEVKPHTVEKFENETNGEQGAENEVYNSNHDKFTFQTSRSPQNKLQEVCILNPSYNNINDINKSDHLSIPISEKHRSDRMDGMEKVNAYKELIESNIDLDILLSSHPTDRELIFGIRDLILETVLCQSDTLIIASNSYPTELVRGKLLKLSHAHIEYVLECMQRNTSKVMNIKKYLLAALFNAPSTMDSYYRSEVNHDFPQYV